MSDMSRERIAECESPVVGWCQQHGDQRERLAVSIGKHPGNYCLECYAEWVAKNIPHAAAAGD